MVQGTGSDVGKSLLVAGLCRAALRRGLKVAPFKPQNMSNNAAVTSDGGEIGRAQALQAKACALEPTCDMNPVLLKPEGETGAQLIVHGRVEGRAMPGDYRHFKKRLLPSVLESFARLKANADLVLVEGAGSPAEVNLRVGDIANFGFAAAADVPVVLVGDVEKGGVIAQLVGTHAVMTPSERQLTAGFIVNKFRGDVALFHDAVTDIEARTGWPSLGVVPWLEAAVVLPQEDSASVQGWGVPADADGGAGSPIKVAVLMFKRIANFDDLDPLAGERDVDVIWLEAGQPLPGDIDLVVLPGSKAVLSDLQFLKEQGWDVDLKAHVRRGGFVVGLCGGYQMLGSRISDPDGIEGERGNEHGLGLLDIETVLADEKTLEHVSATEVETGTALSGYEMHLGLSEGPGRERPWHKISDGRFEGAVDNNNRVFGTYLHGLFGDDAFRHGFLSRLREGRVAGEGYDSQVEAALDALADHLEAHLDIDQLLKLAR